MRSTVVALSFAVLCGCTQSHASKALAECSWDIRKNFPVAWSDAYNKNDPLIPLLTDCMAAQGYKPDEKACPKRKTDASLALDGKCYQLDD